MLKVNCTSIIKKKYVDMEEMHQHVNGSYFWRMGFLGDCSFFISCFYVVIFVCNEHSLLVKSERNKCDQIEKNNIVNCSYLCACLCVVPLMCVGRQISVGHCLSVKYIIISWSLGFSCLKNVIKSILNPILKLSSCVTIVLMLYTTYDC